jgi:hypothetical protein
VLSILFWTFAIVFALLGIISTLLVGMKQRHGEENPPSFVQAVGRGLSFQFSNRTALTGLLSVCAAICYSQACDAEGKVNLGEALRNYKDQAILASSDPQAEWAAAFLVFGLATLVAGFTIFGNKSAASSASNGHGHGH